MMLVKVTAMMLVDLLNGKFTEEACEAIGEFFEEFPPEEAPSIGDIAVCFGEIPSDDVEDGDNVIAHLNNGNVVIVY